MTQDVQIAGEADPFAALRRFAKRAPVRYEERCELCGEGIAPEHRHLLDLASRQLMCACRACSILLDTPAAGGGARRLVPTRCLSLTDLAMTNAQWDALQIPVKMAFISYSTAAKRMTAFYPSPAGSTESLLSLDAWEDLAERSPVLKTMEPDVEALLVDRRSGGGYYLAPIDECYTLVGLVRLHWKGLSGGEKMQDEIDRFFARLKERATLAGAADA